MSNLVGGFQKPDINGECRYHSPIDISKISPTLEPGVYRIDNDYKGTFVVKEPLYTDRLIPLTGSSPVGRLLAEVEKFLDPKSVQRMKDFGQVHRRGFLLYGPPGSGKTSMINMLAQMLAHSHGVITFLNPDPTEFAEIGKAIHDLNPSQFMLVVYEDFEHWTHSTNLLALLDGQKSVPNTMYIATTNYLDQLEKRIVDRPSRFATKIEVGSPEIEVRKEYFFHHIPEAYREGLDLDEWATKTEGLMIDHLKHVAQYVFIFGHTLDEAVAILRTAPPSETLVCDDDEEDD